MTPFSELAPIWRGVFLSAALLTSFASLYALIYASALRLGARHIVGCTAVFAATSLLQQWAYDIARFTDLAVALLLMLAALVLLTAYLIARLYKLRRTRISAMSVKEGIEHLPTGLCFCEERGLVLLMNRTISSLCHAITGGALRDAAAFWAAVHSGEGQGDATAIQSEPSPIWRLADGSVISFSRQEMTVQNRRIYRITAADITEQYRLHTRLLQENRRLREMNERLRRHGETVQAVARDGEALAAKVRLHDELGRISLVARRAMRPDASYADRAALLENWRQRVALIRPDVRAEPVATGFDQLRSAAQAIGVAVHVRGALPAAGTRAARLFQMALHECLTNAVRHAGGSELYADIREGAPWTMTVTNNGRIPDAPIAEGSGLSSLRASIEHAGGHMRISHAPRFALTIAIPTESEDFA
ncbi:MAG: hypothetical protein ACOYI5_03415 [Christensenellales bacterium]|jgi:signal transduction histidine kinase